MDSENIKITNQEESDSGKFNLLGFFYLINNSKETNKILQDFSENLSKFFELNGPHYNRINEILYQIDPEKIRKNYINTPIYKLEKIFAKIIQIQFISLEVFISKYHICSLIQNEISNMQKIIEELSISNVQNNDSNKSNDNDTNSMLNSLKKNMSELENKVIDEYIWEKYKKHIPDVSNNNVEQIVSDIKYIENSIFGYHKEKNEKYFEKIKESDNKIQIVFNKVKKYFMEYCTYLKDIYKNINKELENLEKLINSGIMDEDEINKETTFCSKSDFAPNEKFFDSNKYKIKILKNNKIQIQGPNFDNKKEIKHEDTDNQLTKSFTFQENPNNNILKGGLFEDNFLFLNDKDIYEITSKLYSFNLKLLDKSHYNLELKKGKLIAMDLSNEILLYNEDKEEIKNKFKEKYDEIKDSIDKKILNNIENIESFFIALNNYRVTGKMKFTEKFYDLIIYIFNKTQDELLKNSNNKISDLMLILSQTYFKEIEGKKIYVIDSIKTHELFKNIHFWKSITIRKIEEEFKVIKKFNSKNGLFCSISQGKKEEIIHTKLIPLSELMKDCDLEKDKIIELINQIFDKYKCSKNIREEVLSFINQKK